MTNKGVGAIIKWKAQSRWDARNSGCEPLISGPLSKPAVPGGRRPFAANSRIQGPHEPVAHAAAFPVAGKYASLETRYEAPRVRSSAVRLGRSPRRKSRPNARTSAKPPRSARSRSLRSSPRPSSLAADAIPPTSGTEKRNRTRKEDRQR